MKLVFEKLALVIYKASFAQWSFKSLDILFVSYLLNKIPYTDQLKSSEHGSYANTPSTITIK